MLDFGRANDKNHKHTTQIAPNATGIWSGIQYDYALFYSYFDFKQYA
jgi:hypothetical protein